MGHYCRICARTRPNEKFSGKGHKSHVCKDCSRKSRRKAETVAVKENVSDLEGLISSDADYTMSENTYHDYSWTYEDDFNDVIAEDDKDQELPF